MRAGRTLRYVRQTQFQSIAYFWKGEVILGRTANGSWNEIQAHANNFQGLCEFEENFRELFIVQSQNDILLILIIIFIIIRNKIQLKKMFVKIIEYICHKDNFCDSY